MEESGNSLAYARESTAKRFAERLEGSLEALVLVATQASLGQQARQALVKSFDNLGWGTGLTWLFVDAPALLSKAEFYEAIEGLDPVIVVLAGDAACTLAADAFACDIPTQGRFRLFGRNACAFDNLEALLQSESGKQTVWGLLKTLPKAAQ